MAKRGDSVTASMAAANSSYDAMRLSQEAAHHAHCDSAFLRRDFNRMFEYKLRPYATHEWVRGYVENCGGEGGEGGEGGSSITDARAETLPAGSDATAEIDGTTLVLGIPAGATGEQGPAGADGVDGADGLSMLSGQGAPSNEAPAGTTYLDVETGNVYKYR